MIYVIRHALRCDYGSLEDQKQVLLEFDTPINEIGKWQAYRSAVALKEAFPELLHKKVMLISSPFLRCLQTAEQLIVGFEKDEVQLLNHKVFVEDAISETQREGVYKPSDFGRLTFFNQQKIINTTTQYNSVSELAELHHDKQPFPENDTDITNRVKNVLKSLIQMSKSDEYKEVIFMLVTHGFWVNELADLFKVKRENSHFANVSKLTIDGQSELKLEFLNKRFWL